MFDLDPSQFDRCKQVSPSRFLRIPLSVLSPSRSDDDQGSIYRMLVVTRLVHILRRTSPLIISAPVSSSRVCLQDQDRGGVLPDQSSVEG